MSIRTEASFHATGSNNERAWEVEVSQEDRGIVHLTFIDGPERKGVRIPLRVTEAKELGSALHVACVVAGLKP